MIIYINVDDVEGVRNVVFQHFQIHFKEVLVDRPGLRGYVL